MDVLLLLARLILAVVFVVAGIAKLLDPGGSRKALTGFGLPAAFAAPGGILLPLAELIIGVLLLPRATAQWAAIGALTLLIIFVAAIGYNLARGRTPDCHCFGQIYSEPVGVSTLVRNGVLAVIAGFLLIGGWNGPGPSVVGWLGDLSNAERVVAAVATIALLAAIAEAWLLIHLLSQNGRVLLRIDAVETMLKEGIPAAAANAPAATNGQRAPGLPVGSPAPTFRLEGLHGETMTLDALRASGRPVMLIFTDPGCGPCNALLPDLGKWQRDFSNKMDIAVLSRGKAEANKAKAAEHGLSRVLLQQDREVAQLYEAYGTPSAVIVRPDGTIGSPLAGGAEAIRNLVATTTGTLTVAAAPVPPRPAAQPQPAPSGNGGAAAPPAPVAPRAAVGAAAPAVSLPDVNGKTVNLSDFTGDRTAVLFWNPGCGFCKRMLDDLKAWEENPPKGSTKLLIVSTGEPAANTALGLKSPLVLDQGFSVGRAFGASGTPSAVLVDASGKVASDVVVGAPAVMALVRGEDPAKANGGAPAAAAPKAASKGDPAPTVKLPDLEGKQFDLKSRRGGKTMLLFWNPGCGFCKRMLDDLKAWEASPPKGAPKLVIVSTGTVEANEALGFKSTILLDEGFSVGRAFGAGGTPSAVLIDAKGNIASEVAVGAPGVLALAGATPKEPAATV
jgi:peroxiredoxin/uncharacterized membrane protein YphA (DoxX/SURF4 family)